MKNRISEIKASDDLIAASQIVRDLTIVKTQRKLLKIEEQAMGQFMDRMLNEWSVRTKTDVETLRIRLNGYIREIRERASV